MRRARRELSWEGPVGGGGAFFFAQIRDPQERIPDRANTPEGVRFAAAKAFDRLESGCKSTLKLGVAVVDTGNDAPVGELTAITSCGTVHQAAGPTARRCSFQGSWTTRPSMPPATVTTWPVTWPESASEASTTT
jgi:hypothetical protein